MTKLAIVMLLLVVPGATAVELDAAQQAKCDAQGGCHIITLRSLEDFFRRAYDAGMAAGVAQRCGT